MWAFSGLSFFNSVEALGGWEDVQGVKGEVIRN